MHNDYLTDVVSGTRAVEEALSRKRPVAIETAADVFGGIGLDVRTTGFWRWKTVVVPPNTFVVHTRRGIEKPLTCGIGSSFRYNPYTDAFMVVPSAMQTIIVNANCICAERQGIMVQAYVQWIIDDFSLAYQRLDFGDPTDPMRVTNMQLKQQAEATIKDTVATMSIDAVLSDKQPIIEELTRRLRQVADGGEDGAGLGLRIVTVQIKEAIVSSAKLWETLQRGFRAERHKEARLAELASQSVVNERKNEEALKAERLELQREEHISQLRAESEARIFDAEAHERARRARLAAETAAEEAAHRRTLLEHSAATDKVELELALIRKKMELSADMDESRQRLALEQERMRIDNEISPDQVKARLVEVLPEIMKTLPAPEKLVLYGAGSNGVLDHLVGGVAQTLDRLGSSPDVHPSPPET